MQLAATQRAHPPPVPPRPSRQVVAEALKRSPRPPCPTRQAPPPPNAKPWRSDREQSVNNKQQQVCPTAGRTVVYESIKESSGSKETSDENNDHSARIVIEKEADRRASASERCDEEENRRGRNPPRERRHRAVLEQQHRENPTEPPSERSVDRPSSNLRENSSSSDSTFKDRLDQDESERTKQCKETTLSSNARNEKEEPSRKTPAKSNVSFDDERLSPSISPESSGEKSKLNQENKFESRPAPTQRSCLAKYRDSAAKKNLDSRTNAENVDQDRSMVVVVNESDRKAESNDLDGDGGLDDDDDGDDDDEEEYEEEDRDGENIHRQDWLEAGVPYSSTQIRLSGDDADRVNGLDRCENEKYTREDRDVFLARSTAITEEPERI
uniref:nucleolar protein dao-5-like isoform X2 n=1 Tax=Osmia lignaria TaxID=473952 RepID=UPI001479731C|nr:nucleolar protein dao-5-like isoform X2 [Osmia lignaria]